jgi:hypothetical protein
MNQEHQDHQHPQNTFKLLEGHGSLPSTPQEQIRAMLWRQRMKLEFEMQGLTVRSASLVQEWQRLHGYKAAAGNEVSQIAGQLVLAGFVRSQQERTSWQPSYERVGIAQEEHRIQQNMLRCSMDIATLKAQIIRLDFELARL